MEQMESIVELGSKEKVVNELEKRFGKEAADIIYTKRSERFKEGEVFNRYKQRSGLLDNEEVTAKMLIELDPSIDFLLNGGETTYDKESAFKTFSNDIRLSIQELLDEHKQIKGDLSATGKATAGPNIDERLEKWSGRFTKAQNASLGIAVACFKENLPIPNYTFK